MCPGCLSLIHRMSIYTGTEHEFESVCWPCVCVCVHCESSDGGAVPAILCDHEGRGSVQQFFSHFVKSISAQLLLLLFPSLVSSHWEHYATSPPPASYLHTGSIMQHHHPFTRMVLNALLSLTVSKQDPTRLYGWNLCS